MLWLVLQAMAASAQAPEGAVSDEEGPDDWYVAGEREIEARRARLGPPAARNVVLFVGDGMSLTTITAARILAGQQAGKAGEGHRLAFEDLPYTALAKTYNTNQQTPDSAGTMTAMATGVKTWAGAIAVDQRAARADCMSAEGRELVSILDLANAAGLATGIVTTARLTHATPAALFAKSAERRWESDAGFGPAERESGCADIARQFIEYPIGDGIDVAFGGGRTNFLPAGERDPEYDDLHGRREDGRNLVAEWRARNPAGAWVWNRETFDALPEKPEGNVLGLFEPSHMQYEHDRPDDAAGEPSLAEMTVKALAILEWRGGDGYVLVVEGARIDHAHHFGNAYRALTDTIAFSDAVAAALARVDLDETMIVVTADHGHALSFSGYPERGNPILGLAYGSGPAGGPPRLQRDVDGKPYTTLSYYNGPGYRPGPRPDYGQESGGLDPTDPDFRQEALVGFEFATHSGEDVAVYAGGPGAGVLHGSIEQHLLFHAMVQAQPALAKLAGRIRGDGGYPDWKRLLSELAQESEPKPVEAPAAAPDRPARNGVPQIP